MDTLTLHGRALAVLRDGADLERSLSPRPYLHPIRTLAGTPVTETRPSDHLHHLGLSVAVPDVSGVSFWGGRTFTRDRGSVLLDNHGHQRHRSWLELDAHRRVQALSWTGPDGARMLDEQRTLRATHLDEHTWVLDVRTRLRNTSGRELSIGSPATNGRPGAGYGGLFWRAPAGPAPPSVTGEGGLRGEGALHGSRAGWLALSGADAHGRRWTLLLCQPGEHTDPWFLRAHEYPGAGPALAWDARLPLPRDAQLERRLRVAVRDGHPEDVHTLEELAASTRALS